MFVQKTAVKERWSLIERKKEGERKRERERKQRKRESIGCGAIGRAVTSDTRDLTFESSHWPLY